jgi:hypothetical protein
MRLSNNGTLASKTRRLALFKAWKMISIENLAPEIAERGFAIFEDVLNQDAIARLLSGFEQSTGSSSMRRRGGIIAFTKSVGCRAGG